MPQQNKYAVLWHHDVAEPHYDLLFETSPGSQLATWRVSVWPIERPIEAKRLRDHRRFYLEFEGDLSDSRGRVERVAGGRCDVRATVDGGFEVGLIDDGPPITIRMSQVNSELWMIAPTKSF